VVHADVADLEAGPVGVDDGVLEVLRDRTAIASIGAVLPMPVSLRPVLRNVRDSLNSEE
jgi:hypothetical protein